ncbi:Uncharacterized protein TCM_037968 [Theobroma cacao]|uniref:Reverse transcriptase zinc-binding domain-containing protein n=1 Tax=Theobroma cacao TaxID=3641 RepID=A0A061GN13_THECC|nr:Uncharacterized protein TCM_037968 [Theobroma cacao]
MGKIQEFGHWQDNEWKWEIMLRRRVFGWEEEQWKKFTAMVNDYHLSAEIHNTVIWKGTPSGDFSVKEFCRHQLDNDSGGRSTWRQVWTNLAPLKVEMFVWQIRHGRAAVKAKLMRGG